MESTWRTPRSKGASTAVQVSTPRRRPHLAHISSLIKNQLIPEDTSETQLKNQKTQMMSQHHAPWLGCGGGVRMVNHRQQVGPQDGNLGTGPPSFSDCTRAPAHCLLLLLSHVSASDSVRPHCLLLVDPIPQRSNLQCPSWIIYFVVIG